MFDMSDKQKVYYIFAHQDDEIGVFNKILDDIKKEKEVFIIYLTNGITNITKKLLSIKRKKESTTVLQKIGIKKKNIFFIGNTLNIYAGSLYQNFDKVHKKLNTTFKKNNDNIEIITHALEGGHEDHDACNLIVKKIGKDFKINDIFCFFMYNSFKTNLFYYKVFNPIKKLGPLNEIKFFSKLSERLFLISLLFKYRSQIIIWIGLYPFIIYHYLFKGYNLLQRLKYNEKFNKPHKGTLLYEKRKFCSYVNFKRNANLFLNNV